MKHTLLFILALSFTLSLPAQTIMSKAEMYEDFDQFVEIVQKYNPQLAVRKAVTGYDAMGYIVSMRSCIDTIQNPASFYVLMKGAVNSLADIHSYTLSVMTPRPLIRALWQYNTFTEVDTNVLYRAASILWKSNNSPFFSFGNYLLYYDGGYYIIGDVILWGDNVSIRLNDKKLVKVAGTDVDQWLRQNMHRQIGNAMRWDFSKGKYYSNSMILPKGEITVRDMHTGRDSAVNLSLYTSFQFQSKAGVFTKKDFSKRLVFYYPEEQLLYLRFPQMEEGLQRKLIREIRHALGHHMPQKIVLDVRNNPGGSDDVWTDVVQYLIGDTIYMPVRVGIRAQEDYLAFYRKASEEELEPYSFLEEQYYVLKHGVCALVPAKNNIGYQGKFYVLQNRGTLSAAHSLSSLHRYSDRFVTVGEPTGTIAGRGGGPALFQLKHSGITFAMECDIDFTNAEKPEDVYQDAVDVPVKCTLEEAERSSFSGSNRSKSYLLERDPYFKAVLELK
ncbi:MAG: hypothetical protein J6X35_04900 [Bacteroidales bacterium]|nr:hypothetical protein [Bacteroidales bacterium]MBP5613464.1 hypothetical protein [Bacteroidales bacterium]